MLQITVFINGATRRYFTKTYKSKYDNEREIDVYNNGLSIVNQGYEKVITFIDEVTNALVSVSPITCLIECKEVIEDETGTKKA